MIPNMIFFFGGGGVWFDFELGFDWSVYADLCKNPVDGFSAGLVDENNIFEWSVTIIGPPDTL